MIPAAISKPFSRLIQGRLGAETLHEALVRQVAERAEGNPLFAEEVVSFLSEQGILHAKDGKLQFDAGAVAAALPASVQNVLNARVDRLAANDRTLLQAASVIGKRFKPDLLAVVIGETEINGRLAAMQALDLIRLDDRSSDYVFKHALVRDAVYQSLLTEHRQELHSKIAQEIERRGGNRLSEVAEVLAHHYSRSNHTDKAFGYLSMAGGRSLGVYSLDEAQNHFAAAARVLAGSLVCGGEQAGGRSDCRDCAIAPEPIRSPTTTNPVAMPTRVRRGALDFKALTAWINSSPARTARSASSSWACG
jgi:predicted ATPase